MPIRPNVATHPQAVGAADRAGMLLLEGRQRLFFRRRSKPVRHTSEAGEQLAPDTISHYRILRKLDRGGMGEVFLAEDTKLGRPLALKLLLAEYTRDPRRLARFEQEARAGLGDSERAFAALEESYKDRHPGMILLKSDPRFDHLRKDARLTKLIRRIEEGAA